MKSTTIKYFKLLYYFVVLFLLIIHNFLITTASIPKNPLSVRYAQGAVNYINNFSTQGWFFFTPVPTDSYYLSLRYYSENKEDIIITPIKKIIKEHFKYPLSSFEKRMHVYIHTSLSLAKLVQKNQDIFVNKEYRELLEFVKFHKPTNYNHAEVTLFKHPPISFSQRREVKNNTPDIAVFNIPDIKL